MTPADAGGIRATLDVAGSIIALEVDDPVLGSSPQPDESGEFGIGTVIYDVVHPEDRLGLADAHRRVVFGESELVPVTLRLGVGSTWFLATGSAARAGDNVLLDLSTRGLAPWRDEPMLPFTLKYEPDVSPNSWVQIRTEGGVVHVSYGGPMTIRRMRRLLRAAAERALTPEVSIRLVEQFRAACTRDRYDEIGSPRSAAPGDRGPL